MSARSVHVTIENRTGFDLTLKNVWLPSAGGTLNPWPPSEIENETKAEWDNNSNGPGLGVEASVSYSSPAGEFYIHWDDPYIGSNKYEVYQPDGYEHSMDGGSGNNASIKVVFEPTL
ncbi:hypothetical protein [Streptomyces luteogriseus]|uniref:hypothetical protein n=1 Tax=Streptomyces luteogriseus TaxID=68233 RepID=UPI002E312B49|nr:hypothetical protein [Streptomyces luteogriseus]WTJ25640.1 hypothetical protein OID52_00440 [Streptomyces luteogriseus]